MDTIYLLMIVALAVLAIADLVVGVSNDAVNFLNSAIGSKAISFKNLMIVASLGIAVGAVFFERYDGSGSERNFQSGRIYVQRNHDHIYGCDDYRYSFAGLFQHRWNANFYHCIHCF